MLTQTDRRREILTQNPARSLLATPWLRPVLLLLLHLPLAWLLWNGPAVVSTAHALGVLLLGLFALVRYRQPAPLVYVTGYIVGAEVLWRLSGAAVFFEYGKYAVSLLLTIGILRYRRLLAADKVPLLYFALLLPGVFLMSVFDRGAVSFNLSGPLSLAVAAMFFSTVRLRARQIETLSFAIVAPVVSQAMFAIFSTLSAASRGVLRFGNDSNPLTAGGDGPNQVSTILGLGALVAFLYFATHRRSTVLRLVMLGLAIWFLAQSAFTFSRGGLYTAAGAILVAAFYLVRDARARAYLFLGALVTVLLLFGFILPQLDAISEGALSTRLQDTTLTGRDLIVQVDWQLFRENPLLGIGIGESDVYHITVFRLTAPHTEPTRLLAEHGSLGLLAMGVILLLVGKRLLRPGAAAGRAYAISFTAWAIATTLHSAMRLVAVGYTFGLGAALLQIPDTDDDDDA